MSDLKSKDNCSGGYPGLWRILYSHSVPVRVPDGFGDTAFSHMKTVNGQYDVIALSEGMAQEAFLLDHPAVMYTRLTNPERICYVDAIALVGRNYGGHFS